MPLETLIYCIGSGILALLVALFQYIYKTNRNKLYWSLAALRFVSIFSLLLLIINPKFENNESDVVKPVLAIAVDNSQSISYLTKDSIAELTTKTILKNSALNTKYNVQLYRFGSQIDQNSSLTFEDSQTNITNSLEDIQSIYDSQLAPIVLITDGNQTIGTDYQFVSKQFNQVVFPFILGDSIFNTDLKIQHVNVNSYTYLNTKFPVEIMASYSGNTSTESILEIRSGNQLLHSERLRFSPEKNSIVRTPTLTSSKVGVQQYKVSLTPIDNEKNRINNQKSFAIETIDEYTNIALISTISHPDLGTLKASIESNKQRLVTLHSPAAYLASDETYGLVILYQPNQEFKAVFERIEKSKLNSFIVGGTHTKWSFLNSIQSDFNQEYTNQSENYQGVVNSKFSNFSTADYSFSSYPPLTSEFGSIDVKVPHETLVFKSINGTLTQEPLWFTFDYNSGRSAILLAENLWKWRMHSFREDQNFETFDAFMSKLIQYLILKNQNRRLIVNYESIYDGSQPLEINAQFFNKNYEPTSNADLNIKFKNKDTEYQFEFPMNITQNGYTLNISALDPGNYSFEVSVNGGTHKSFGQIEILNFNIEHQFINANIPLLEQLAVNTNGAVYFDTQIDDLILTLISDNRFSSVQKIIKKTVSLIDLKLGLLLLIISLAFEWFIRKYNGLI